MELGPIFRTLLRNKTRLVLISIEVALTLAIVVNCINMMQDMRNQMDRPTGMDESNIIAVRSRPFAEEFKTREYLLDSLKEDLRLLESLPGVRAAAAVNHVPLSGSGSSSGWKPLGSEINTLATARLDGTIDVVMTLGVELSAGRDLVAEDYNDSKSKNVLITKAYADALFPEGDALGQKIQGRTPDNPDTIVGIIEHMHGFWPGWTYIANVLVRPAEAGGFNWGTTYMMRTEPGQVEIVFPMVEEALLAANDGRNVRVETLAEIKGETFSAQTAIIKMLGGVIVLLIFVTGLGIVGITSFSVTERTHTIGTRRALGARQFDILRYFLTENWVIISSGLVLGIGLTLSLNYLLVTFVNGAKLDLLFLAYGIVLMWAIGLVSALFPAWKGARIPPAIATRNV